MHQEKSSFAQLESFLLEYKTESRELPRQVEAQVARLDPGRRADKRVFNVLGKDQAALRARLTEIDALLEAIGGQLTEDQAKMAFSIGWGIWGRPND